MQDTVPHDLANSDPGTRQRRRARRSRLVVIIAGIALLLVALWLVSKLGGGKAKAPPSQGTPVAVADATTGNIDVYLDALGTVTPVNTVTVASRVAGALTEVHYKEGQNVKKNDLLATIDPRPYVAAQLQAQGQLSRDQAALKNARIDMTRYENSFKEHAISQQQVATQQALIDQDEGTVKVDEGNLAAADVNVDYTRIRSPIDGRVGLRTVDPGNIVPANGTTGLLTITQLQPITVIFTIAEDQLGDVTDQMKPGHVMPVKALDRSKQHEIAQGTLITVDNQVNTSSGTVRARAEFPNTNNELFPNQFVNARLLVKTLTEVTLLPQSAVQHNNDAAFVYIVQPDSTVKQQNVKILASEGDSIAVSDVQAGQKVVTDGFDKLQNGAKITVRAPAAQDTAKTT
jgi:multidrug efflux system membrane fusion protein